MSAGNRVPGATSPKAVEVKGPQATGKSKAPNMSNKNAGTSPVGVARTESESATRAGFKGEHLDVNIKDENRDGSSRNKGSALRGGASKSKAHSTGNRYGK